MSGTGDRIDRTPRKDAEVCVIGSGPAGALVAYTLAKRGHDVVVLEAGKRFEFDDRLRRMEEALRPAHWPDEIWNMGGDRDAFTTTGNVFYPLNRKRVKGIGGTTLHWGAAVWRFHEKDFEMNTRYGLASDWPINYDDLQPYYAKAEQEMGVAGNRDNPFGPPRETDFPMEGHPPSYSDTLFVEACEELGITVHTQPRAINSRAYDGRSECQGFGTCIPVCPSGAKYSADVHVEKAEAEGARVIDRAPVQRLEHDPTGETVSYAEYVVPDGSRYRQEASHFVLACGAVEIPRLLFLSRSETYPDGLANSSGLVGKYFMDHPAVNVFGRIDEPTRQHLIGFNTSGTQQFYDHEEPTPGSIMMGFKNFAGPSPIDVALHGGETGPRGDLSDPFFGDEWGDELLETIREKTDSHLQMGVGVEQLPHEENRVTLDTSQTDNHGNPAPKLTYSVGERVRTTLRKGIDIGTDIFDHLGASKISANDVGQPAVTGHQMGTTRMGVNSETSVVNPRMRTHDLNNLWIASGSVFVTGGAVVPTLTIAAVALKAAEHIDEEL